MKMRAGMILAGCLASATASLTSEPDGAGLQPGSLPGAWQTGEPDCVTVLDWQVHEYEDFYILRESGCTNYEKPFLYLIFGHERAPLEDTGAGRAVQTAPFVMDLLVKWAKKKNHASVALTVIHSHGHGDHTVGDKQFQALPTCNSSRRLWPMCRKPWASPHGPPTRAGSIQGGRILDIITIPGHHEASVAIYDRLTGNLLTGDSLYSGRLYVPDDGMASYTASARRLASFVKDHPIAHVLGTHVEQAKTPYLDYERGSTY
jgi:hydroxyacylglutathione hydrolase